MRVQRSAPRTAPATRWRGQQGGPQYPEETPPLSQGPNDELGGHAGAYGTDWTPSLWTRALGQMPDANRFCHQDTEGLDAGQLPLPRDRLRERRRALGKIDERCQKMISPQRDAGSRRSSNPRQRGLLGAGGPAGSQQPARRAALPWPSCSPALGAHNSQVRGRAGGAHTWEGLWATGSPGPPGESGSYCLYPFYSPSTDPLGGVRSQGPVQPRHKQWL